MASSIGPAGLALATLIETAATTVGNALYGVQISFGPPDQYEENEVVALIGVSALDELARVLGPQPNVRDENYGLDVAIRCEDPAGTAKEVWTRGWAMYDAVRDVVLANPKLSNTVMWGLPTPKETTGVVRALAEDGSEKRRPGHVIRIDMAVICKARA